MMVRYDRAAFSPNDVYFQQNEFLVPVLYLQSPKILFSVAEALKKKEKKGENTYQILALERGIGSLEGSATGVCGRGFEWMHVCIHGPQANENKSSRTKATIDLYEISCNSAYCAPI